MKQFVISGDNIETLKSYPDNYFDSVVTDCPYGLGNEPNAQEMLKAWVDTGYLEVKGSGFMGKEWDSFVPQPIFWKEIYRVLKYGGHIVAFFGTRTYDWGCMAIRLGGFEIRDCIQWVYGSGFPKSHNISKAIDKKKGAEREVVGKKNYSMPKADNNMGENSYGISGGKLANGTTAERIVGDITAPSTEQAKQWEGWGSALKPANEPIVLARKPLEKGLSIAENVMKWGTGGINVDGCRIGNDTIPQKKHIGNSFSQSYKENGGANYENLEWEYNKGRFPANFIMSHHPNCECEYFKYNGEEEINENWDCHENCPIKILDEQSGESTGTLRKPNGKSILNVENGWNDNSMIDNTTRGHNDKGGASRFFYVAKASQWERSFGLDEFEEKIIEGRDKGQDERAIAYKTRPTPKKNIHPTVKPIKLMQYLIRLVTQPNGIVLDAFAGSGTTGIACKIDGFNFVGLELSEEYTEIANARIQAFNEELLFIDETIIYKNREEKDDTDYEQLSLF